MHIHMRESFKLPSNTYNIRIIKKKAKKKRNKKKEMFERMQINKSINK